MTVDKAVLAAIALIYDENLFTKFGRVVADWCVGYYNRYGEPPKENIEREFQKWASRTKDDSTVSLVEKFLEGLSGEYESLSAESNSQYVLDTAAEYFRKVKLQKLAEGVQAAVEDEDVAAAQGLVDNFHPIAMGADAGIDVLGDLDAAKRAFEARAAEPLIIYPGALGSFFGSALARDNFIAILAPSKRAKSYVCLDMGVRGMKNRKRVAYFQIGDLTEAQIQNRFSVRFAKRPFYATQGNVSDKFNKPIRIPETIVRTKDRRTEVTFKERHFPTKMTLEEMYEGRKKTQQMLRSKTPLLKLSVHDRPITVKGIESILQQWEDYDDWIADIVIVDYADLLAPLDSRQDKRHQIDDTWKALRILSQYRHCLLITATQSDAKGAEVVTLTRSNFSDNQLKNAHVTGMLGLNQTHEEKENQTWRLNWLQLREEEFIETQCVHVAGCLAIANPFMKSTW